jgi:hypothetical protein
VKDVVDPSTTISGIGISADTGTASDDFNTKTAAQTMTATLSAAISGGDTVQVSVDGGSSYSDVNDDVTGTALSTSITLAGSSSITIRVTDPAGNSGSVASQAYTLDTTAPLKHKV